MRFNLRSNGINQESTVHIIIKKGSLNVKQSHLNPTILDVDFSGCGSE